MTELIEFEMFVELLIPDSIAITARKALERMGYKIDVRRADYYKFKAKGENDLSAELGKVDILVNANKHKFIVKKHGEKLESLDKEGKEGVFAVRVIVKDIDNPGKGILATLRDRLGFTDVEECEKGTMWTLFIKAKARQDALKVGEEITKSLLFNEHFQEYKII